MNYWRRRCKEYAPVRAEGELSLGERKEADVKKSQMNK